MSEDKFVLNFHPKAQKEYSKLDGSSRNLVDKGLAKLRFRADEIGKPLSNKRGTLLTGCRELKFKQAGLRVVYRLTGEKQDQLEIVWILSTGNRADEEVFTDSVKRLKDMLDRKR